MIRIKHFVCPHNSYKVLGVAEVYDIVCISRQHVYCLDLVAADFKFNDFVCSDLAFLNEAVTGDYNEEFPLTVVPVLAFCDSGL